MKLWLLCLTLGCGVVVAQGNAPVLPSPAPPPLPLSAEEMRRQQRCHQNFATIFKTLRQNRLPIELLSWNFGSESSCQFIDQAEIYGVGTEIYGVGTVSAQVVERALAKAGLKTKVMLSTAPPPLHGLVTSSTLPLKAEVAPIAPQRAGGKLTAKIGMQNLTFFNLWSTYGTDTVRYALISEHGEVVRWNGNGPVFDIGFSFGCAPFQPCGALTADIPLNHFNADLPLEPGHYKLCLTINRLSIGNTTISATLPDVAFDILP
jgi:hypothetical protein